MNLKKKINITDGDNNIVIENEIDNMQDEEGEEENKLRKKEFF